MKISERGQITLPKKIRDRHGLKPNTEVEVIEVGQQIVIQKKQTRDLPVNAVRGVLVGHASAKTTDEVMRQLRDR
jgi:AbrB family looped-hinge helix DNA binding protein